VPIRDALFFCPVTFAWTVIMGWMLMTLSLFRRPLQLFYSSFVLYANPNFEGENKGTYQWERKFPVEQKSRGCVS